MSFSSHHTTVKSKLFLTPPPPSHILDPTKLGTSHLLICSFGPALLNVPITSALFHVEKKVHATPSSLIRIHGELSHFQWQSRCSSIPICCCCSCCSEPNLHSTVSTGFFNIPAARDIYRWPRSLDSQGNGWPMDGNCHENRLYIYPLYKSLFSLFTDSFPLYPLPTSRREIPVQLETHRSSKS